MAAARFHGHLGPWLVLGLRTGRYARRILGGSPFDLEARVHCPARTPYTCFLDGIQFGSGCTLGKGNIRHVRSTRVWVEFARRESGCNVFMARAPGRVRAGLKLELHPDVWTELHLKPARTQAAVAALGREIFRRPFRKLFLKNPHQPEKPT